MPYSVRGFQVSTAVVRRMAVCPNCERSIAELRGPCPSGDGYFGVAEDEYHSYSDDGVLGREIGDRFIVESVLGRGSMSRVYRAYQRSVERAVALKVFRPETILGRAHGDRATEQERREAEERFVREAKVLGRLSHPNCVTVYDFGSEDDGNLLYMAMEFVAGTSLRAAIRRRLSFDAIAEIGHQCLEAMREAHSTEIVHRDLKPENILLSFRYSNDEQVVKVLDFGIAKLLRSEGEEEDSENRLYGTPAYMAPEQCRGDVDAVGPPADIYAFGCVFYELVCGRLPYSSEQPRELVRLHLQADVPPLHPRDGLELPEAVEDFVVRCLQKDPGERFESAHAALRALQEALVDSEVSVGDGLTVGSSGDFKRVPPDAGRRKVSVPDDRVKGIELDPVPKEEAQRPGSNGEEGVGDRGGSASEGTPGPNAGSGVDARPSEKEAERDGRPPSGAPKPSGDSDLTGVAIAVAVLTAVAACVVVLYYIYAAITAA